MDQFDETWWRESCKAAWRRIDDLNVQLDKNETYWLDIINQMNKQRLKLINDIVDQQERQRLKSNVDDRVLEADHSEIKWRCSNCGYYNVDIPAWTTNPQCMGIGCGCAFDWREILRK